MFVQVRQQFLFEFRCGRAGADGLHDGVHDLAQFVVGDAEDGGVGDVGVPEQKALGLLRVDIHPAGKDEVDPSLGQVQVAILVEIAQGRSPRDVDTYSYAAVASVADRRSNSTGQIWPRLECLLLVL